MDSDLKEPPHHGSQSVIMPASYIGTHEQINFTTVSQVPYIYKEREKACISLLPPIAFFNELLFT